MSKDTPKWDPIFCYLRYNALFVQTTKFSNFIGIYGIPCHILNMKAKCEYVVGVFEHNWGYCMAKIIKLTE